MHRLARDSHDRLRALSHDLHLDFERTDGYLVLLRSQRELKQARAGLKLLAELGETFHLVDATRARQSEPGLNPQTPLHPASHLPGARLGKCKAIGPILLGVGAPVHVLQTGDDVNAIVQIASVAVMDAMGR